MTSISPQKSILKKPSAVRFKPKEAKDETKVEIEIPPDKERSDTNPNSKRKVFQKQKSNLSADQKLITQIFCVKIGLKPGYKLQIMWALRIFSLVATDLP